MNEQQSRPAGEPEERPAGRHTDTSATEPVTRDHVVTREREEHGGVKIGSAFFGWLAATGMVVLLSGLVAVTGVVTGRTTDTDTATETAAALDLSMEALGVLGIVVALVIWFVSYFSGGYVAGRMARFDGMKQGVAVWVWSIVVAVLLGVLGAAFGNDYAGGGIPDVRFDETTTAVLIGVAVVLLTSLVGAVLGGLAGMRFHRRVDRTGLGA